jgi:hypothetical protein
LITITLRSPVDGIVELVIAANGGCEVIPIPADQLRSIAFEAVQIWARQCERSASSEPAAPPGSMR